MNSFYTKWKTYLMLDEHNEDSTSIAKAAILFKNNQILLLKRSSTNKKFADQWDLPGGHLKMGENTTDGLIREVEEETGIKISKKRVESLGSVDNKTFHIVRKDTMPEDIVVKLSDEHSDYAIVSYDEIENFNLSREFINVIDKAYGND
tara:strand:- start:1880 stop:2326 length:447 start_codon:yes stop_codon:yes gene_type:complete